MWIRDQIDARGYESTEEAARALGVYPSLLRHWATIVRSPSPQVLRQVAVLFDAPIQDVLIAAGYMTMTEEENRPLPDQDVAATNVEQANPRRDMPPHSRRHRRTPYSSASERSTSHPRRMDQHTLGVPPLGSFAVSRPIASKPSRPAARRTHSHCRAGKGSKQRVGRADHVGSSATAPRRSRRSPGPNSTKLLQIEVQPQRVLECGESLHPDLADRFRIQTPNRYRTHLLRLRFRRSRQT